MSGSESIRDEVAALRAALVEQGELLEELRRSTRHGRKRLLAHAFLYAALLVVGAAASAGALAGKNTVFSDDITDGNVKRPDIAAGAVSGAKVADGSITGADVTEKSLNLDPFFAAVEAHDVDGCNADDAAEICATAAISLAKAGTVQIVATGNWHTTTLVGDDGDQVAGTVELLVDGVPGDGLVRFGERRAISGASETHYAAATAGQFAVVDLAALAAGPHTVKLRFTDVDGDVDVRLLHLVVTRASS